MPHNHHEHGSCQEEGHSHDGHSHETPVEDIPRSTLYQIIDHDNVVVYNVVDKTKKVIKPWDQRNDEAIVSTALSPISWPEAPQLINFGSIWRAMRTKK